MPDSFGDALQNFLQKLYREKSKWERVLSAWEQVASEFKNYAWPSLWRRGVLVVEVQDSNWLYFLNFKKQELIEKLNELLPPENKIQEIRLKVR